MYEFGRGPKHLFGALTVVDLSVGRNLLAVGEVLASLVHQLGTHRSINRRLCTFRQRWRR